MEDDIFVNFRLLVMREAVVVVGKSSELHIEGIIG